MEGGSHHEDHSLGYSGTPGGSPVLVGSLPGGGGSSSGLPAVQSDTDNGCLKLWLGGSPGRGSLLGKVDSPGIEVSRKRSRSTSRVSIKVYVEYF